MPDPRLVGRDHFAQIVLYVISVHEDAPRGSAPLAKADSAAVRQPKVCAEAQHVEIGPDWPVDNTKAKGQPASGRFAATASGGSAGAISQKTQAFVPISHVLCELQYFKAQAHSGHRFWNSAGAFAQLSASPKLAVMLSLQAVPLGQPGHPGRNAAEEKSVEDMNRALPRLTTTTREIVNETEIQAYGCRRRRRDADRRSGCPGCRPRRDHRRLFPGMADAVPIRQTDGHL